MVSVCQSEPAGCESSVVTGWVVTGWEAGEQTGIAVTCNGVTTSMMPDTPPSLAQMKRQLAGLQRAAGASALDQQGWMRMGELEFDIKEREKKRLKYGR